MISLAPNLELFRHHFADLPVVPGILLLTEPHRNNAAGDLQTDFLDLRNVRFKEFVRSGDMFEVAAAQGSKRRVTVGDRICCEYEQLEASGSNAFAPTAGGSEDFEERSVPTLRGSDYWFLPEKIGVSRDLGSAEVSIDTSSIANECSFLKEVPSWKTLLLVESMGNLSLALNSLSFPDIDYDRFVFAQMKRIRIPHPASSVNPGSRFLISTSLTRKGSMIVWNASAHDIESRDPSPVCHVEAGVSYLRGTP